MLVPGCSEPSEDPDPIEIFIGGIYARDTGTKWVYDVYFPIKEVNMDKPPVWEDISVHVETVITSDLYPLTEVLIDQVRLTRQPSFEASDEQVFYYQNPGIETERIAKNGFIGIQGMDLSFQNAQVSLLFKRTTLTYINLHLDFPVPPCYITFSEPVVSPIKSVIGNHWDLSWSVLDIEPENCNVSFEKMTYRIDGANSDLFITGRQLGPDPETGGPYDPESHGEEMQVWYVSSTNITLLRVGDIIRMTYIDNEYKGAKFDLMLNGPVVKTTYLPEDFP